jgi:hypothetical protein
MVGANGAAKPPRKRGRRGVKIRHVLKRAGSYSIWKSASPLKPGMHTLLHWDNGEADGDGAGEIRFRRCKNSCIFSGTAPHALRLTHCLGPRILSMRSQLSFMCDFHRASPTSTNCNAADRFGTMV